MIEDMTIREFTQKTRDDYVQRVKEFASYPKRSPDLAKSEDLRAFSVASGVERRRDSKDQHHHLGTVRLASHKIPEGITSIECCANLPGEPLCKSHAIINFGSAITG